MRQVRKGDLAMVIGVPMYPDNGAIVTVVSDPELCDLTFRNGVELKNVLCCLVDRPSFHNKRLAACRVEWLIPLDPPSDPATLTSDETTDRSVSA